MKGGKEFKIGFMKKTISLSYMLSSLVFKLRLGKSCLNWSSLS